MQDFIENYKMYQDFARVEVQSEITFKNKTYPLVSIRYGNPKAPTLLITGGVHGLERIGALLCLSLLQSFHDRLSWDKIAQDLLKSVQIVFIPLVNPAGYFEVTRSNPQGVDLMRNAPISAEDKVPFLLGGQTYSNKIPWFRGVETAKETEFVISVVKNILIESNQLISLDLHSGFGFSDQLWFPFANSHKEFTQLPELHQFFQLYKKTHPYHIYKIEPQSKVYLTHGDIWDYCFLNFKQEHQVYLPLTLEMGSWMWVKKNPLQLFSKTGLFNPIKVHRQNRTLRRHRPFFDFLVHSLVSHDTWTKIESSLKNTILSEARKTYYDT